MIKEKNEAQKAEDGGFALLLVLWTLGFLALIGAQTLATGREAVRLGDRTLQRVQLETLADAAITSELFGLVAGQVMPVPQWHNAPEEGNARISVRSMADRNRINPNTAGNILLSELLAASGMSQDQSRALAASIFSWRTPANPLGFAGGRKRCKPIGVPFRTFDDLNAVPDMNPVILQALKPHLSFAQIQLPDLSSADPIVRKAIAKSGISNSPDQKQDDKELGEETLLSVDVLAARGGYRLGRHAEVLLLPEARPTSWRVVRWETTTRGEN